MKEGKMMPASRFKVRYREKNSKDISDSNIKWTRFKTEDDFEEKNSTGIRYSISGNLKSKRVPTDLLDDLLKQGSMERKKVFRDLTSSIRDRSTLRFSDSKSMLKPKEQQNIKAIIRNTISKDRSKNKKQLHRKEKWIKQSFSKVIKTLKHRQKILVDKENEHSNAKIQSYAATIKGEKHHVNQDSLAFSEGIYIICDGHGTNGKQISEFVSQTAHKFLLDAYNQKKIDTHHIRTALKKTQLELDISGIDVSFSGCTFLGIIIFENSIFTISVGDSKAIMGHGITTSELSVLHKPDYPNEKARIESCGGAIHPIEIGKDKYSGPNRIWAPGKNSWGPGLALSRAFGDKAARKYGLISEPEIKNIRLTYQIDYIILGSDGLFDFMKDSEISFVIRKKLKQELHTRDGLALELVEEARRVNPQDSDDISCIIILL